MNAIALQKLTLDWAKRGNWANLNFANCFEVIRHSTAKLNKMKTDNIKIEVPDEIATDMHKNLF